MKEFCILEIAVNVLNSGSIDEFLVKFNKQRKNSEKRTCKIYTVIV